MRIAARRRAPPLPVRGLNWRLPQGDQHFRVARPILTHWRTATCEEYGCKHYLMGWRTVLNISDPKMRDAADWIRHRSGLSFAEKREGEMLIAFKFPPGQRCFASRTVPHRVPLDRQEIYRHEQRGVVRLHERPQDWQEHWNEEADKFNRARQRG